MAHIPPSAPHLPWLARPGAICHTNGILYECGIDISPPGETDGTFHYTSKQLQKTVNQNIAENVSAWVKAGNGKRIVSDSSAATIHRVSG